MPASVAELTSLQVDAVGLALLVRTATEDDAGLRRAALAAPVEADRVALLVSAQVAARDDLLTAATPLILERLDDCELGLRVLPAGDAQAMPLAESRLWALGAATGRQVVGPEIRVAASAPHPPETAPVTPPPEIEPGRLAPESTPSPSTTTKPAPAAESQPARTPESRPAPTAENQPTRTPEPQPAPTAENQPTRTPEPQPAPVEVSGSKPLTHDPGPAVVVTTIEPEHLVAGPATAPLQTEKDSGPQQVRAEPSPRVAEPGPAAEIVLPGPTGAGWSFADDGDPLVGAHPAGGCFIVQLVMVAGAVRLADRPVRPGTLAERIRECPGWHGQPVLVAPVGGPPPAAAGLYLGPLADALGVDVLAADALLSPDGAGGLVTTGSFRRWAARPAGTSEPRRVDVLGTVLPAAERERPTAVIEPTVLAEDVVALLVVDWVPPAVVTAPERPAPTPVTAPGQPAPTPVTAPGQPASTAAAEPSAVMGEIEPTAVEPDLIGDRPVQESAPQPGPAAGRRFTSAVPIEVTPADPELLPVQLLRAALAEDYDRHARYATRVLAEQPALRLGADPKELLAGLVALRAYCVREWAVVNPALRGTADPDDRVTTIVAWARHGLARCPTELGPVLARTSVDPGALDGYLPGGLLREPGFLDAVAGNPAADGAVEFAIWSLTGRRLGRFGPVDAVAGRTDAVLFDPGTGFEVLAVDPAADESTPARVLLREIPPGRYRPLDQPRLDRILARLRESGSVPDRQRPAERKPGAVGFGPDDLPYPFAAGGPDDNGGTHRWGTA